MLPMPQPARVSPSMAFATLVGLSIVLGAVQAGEKTTITFAGKTVACEVVKFQRGRNDELQMALKMSGVEQTLPLRVFSKEDVSKCYALVMEPKNADLRLGMGEYFYGKELFSESEVELKAVAELDPKLKPKAESLMQKIASARQISKLPDPPKVADKKPDAPKDVAQPKKDKPAKRTIKLPDGTVIELPGSEYSDEEENGMMVVGGDGKPRMEVPPLTEAKMKEFLDKRLKELNDKIGGEWRLIETKHYYCFSNLPKPKHEEISKDWNEKLYDLLCDVLKHKENEKLWNNKLPIYYFDTFKQFQHFAVELDLSPGAQNSGGYFMSRGREVHICIPFMRERYGTSTHLEEHARGTLYHEGTHAFLQLTGEDVSLTRWLHEGMAQFIEFWYQDQKSGEKRDRVQSLAMFVRQHGNTPLPWKDTEQRPMGGTDLEGYSYAWAKLEFFYRNFDHLCLPQMVKLIKSGKTEKEAMETVFKMPLERLEGGYKIWLKDAIKANFKFN